METATRQTLSVEQAAEVLGVGRSAAYAAARSGQLPTIRIGRRMLVTRAALDALLAAPAARTQVLATGSDAA